MRRALAEPPRGGDAGVWHVLRLASLSTLAREYVAVHALSRCAFAPVLLNAAPPAKLHAQPALVIPEVLPPCRSTSMPGFEGKGSVVSDHGWRHASAQGL